MGLRLLGLLGAIVLGSRHVPLIRKEPEKFLSDDHGAGRTFQIAQRKIAGLRPVIWLAGLLSAACMDTSTLCVPASKLILPMPEFMIANIVPPFQMEPSEIEWLASPVEKKMLAKLAPLHGRASSKSSGKLPLDPMLEPGDSPSFYLRGVYATRLSEQIASFYEAQIFPGSLVK